MRYLFVEAEKAMIKELTAQTVELSGKLIDRRAMLKQINPQDKAIALLGDALIKVQSIKDELYWLKLMEVFKD